MMKKMCKAVLSMVLVISMLLSMLLISGITATAIDAVQGEQRYYLTGDKVKYSGNDQGCIPSTLTVGGNAWVLTQTQDAAAGGSVVGAVIVGNATLIETMPYLIVNVSSSTTMLYSWLAWSESSGYVWPFGSYDTQTGVMVYDMRNAVKQGETFTLQLWSMSAAGGTYAVNEMYISNVNPFETQSYIKKQDLLNVGTAGYLQTAVESHDNGIGWTLTLNEHYPNGGQAALISLDAATLSSKRFLVMRVSVKTNIFFSIDGWTASGSVAINPVIQWTSISKQMFGTYTYDLGAVNNAENVVLRLWLGGTVGQQLVVNEMYLSDCEPDTEVLLKDWDVFQYNSFTASQLDAGKKGMLLKGADTLDGFNYWYANIPKTQIEQTPYLVIKPAASAQKHINKFRVLQYNGASIAGATCYHEIKTDNELQIIDLRHYSVNEAVGLQLFLQAPDGTIELEFTYAYLTADPSGITDETDPTVRLQDMTVNLGNVVPSVSDAGLIYPVDTTAVGDQFAYYNELPDLQQYPYLVYKLKSGTVGGVVMHIAHTSWWQDYITLPQASASEYTVVDLSALDNFAVGRQMLLQTLYTDTTQFEYFYFSKDVPLGLEVSHKVTFDTRAAGVPAKTEWIVNGEWVNGYLPDFNKHALLGWYTDEGLTQAFDFTEPVTANVTLYAKWMLIDHISPMYAQLQSGINAESTKAAIRFVAAIDYLEQASTVGILLSLSNPDPMIGGANVTKKETYNVWKGLQAGGATVWAEDLHGEYLFGCTLNNIPNAKFDTTIYVRGFIRLKDNTYVYTDVRAFSVNGMLANQ